MKSFLLAAALVLTALPAQAASLITFSGAPRGQLTATLVEDGFAYSAESGAPFVNGLSPADRNMEGLGTAGGGVLSIVAEDGSLFNFLSLQYAAFEANSEGFQTLTILGLRNGIVVGTDIAVAQNFNRAPSVDASHELVEASVLSGLALDELRIVLNAGLTPNLYFQAVDDIYLSALAVPEPTSWALMIAGFGLVGGVLRQRRVAEAA